MDSNLWEDKLSKVMPCDTPVEESESEGTFPMDVAAILEERFGWTTIGFSRATLSRQFRQAGDSLSLLSSTHVSSTRCTEGTLT